MRWLVERRLKETSARLRSAREDLVRLDHEVESFSSDYDDLRVLSAVSGRVDADRDFGEAEQQAEVLRKARVDLRRRIEDLVQKQDQLLEKLGSR